MGTNACGKVQKMKPLLKWPGGKSSEIRQFLGLIPDYDRYIEPFVGGGALYFYLNPEHAVINDISAHLMQFYELVQNQDPEFHKILGLYAQSFGALSQLCRKHYDKLLTLYKLYAFADEQGLKVQGLNLCKDTVRSIALDPAVCSQLVLDAGEFAARMNESVEDKLLRTVRHNRKGKFSDKDLQENLITGFTSGYYLYFRDVFNEIEAGRLLCTKQYASANFYFVREYCYGSMFRYNKEGKFNIPYGGASYNRKDFSAKVERMFSPQVASLLARTVLKCEDFETMLAGMELTERDFMFLDPPYDTEFSDYEGKDFGRQDQERLAAYLRTTQARFLLVIKNTPFIFGLYEDADFRILAFENRYVYNVRSRNDRIAEHLIITNIPEGEIPWIRENY